MADRVITLPESDADDLSIPVTLGDVRVRLGLRWWPRLSGWYCTMLTESGAVISDARRMAVGSSITADPTVPGHPPGVVVVIGSGDLSARSDLWLVTLVFVGAS